MDILKQKQESRRKRKALAEKAQRIQKALAEVAGNSEELEDDLSGEGEDLSAVDADNDSMLMMDSFEDLADEDKILVFFKRLLNEWNQELNEMPKSERRTANGKQMVATFKECALDLYPFKFCRKRDLPDDMKHSLLRMVKSCMWKDYQTAFNHHLRLVIGVLLVGIRNRSNSVADFMNEATTQDYLRSVKQLVTFCQRKYPTVPPESIEFNCLANYSDFRGRLRLMPAPR